MNFARRSTHNPRTQHQTCVPLHVRHGGLFFLKRDILVEHHGVCTVRKTTRTTCVQELNTNWDLHEGNKSFIRRVDSTQAAFQPARTHCSYNVRHLVLRYHLVFFFKKNTYAELIDGTAPNGNTNTTNRLNWIGAPIIF